MERQIYDTSQLRTRWAPRAGCIFIASSGTLRFAICLVRHYLRSARLPKQRYTDEGLGRRDVRRLEMHFQFRSLDEISERMSC